MKKYAKKVNPYEKKKKRSLKLSKKQWTTLIGVLAVIAILVGVIVVANQAAKSSEGHYEGDGHNHGTSADGHYEGDGHDHGTTGSTNSHSANDGHDHSSTDKVKYQVYKNTDETYRVVFRDNAGKALAEYDKLTKQPIPETINADKGVYELGWATGDGVNEYECVYYNVKTGQVSEKFVAPRGCDGVRIAYGSADQKKVIVQDLFDKGAYYKEHELTNTVEKNGDIIMGGRLQDNKKEVVITYNSSDATGGHITIPLYE